MARRFIYSPLYRFGEFSVPQLRRRHFHAVRVEASENLKDLRIVGIHQLNHWNAIREKLFLILYR